MEPQQQNLNKKNTIINNIQLANFVAILVATGLHYSVSKSFSYLKLCISLLLLKRKADLPSTTLGFRNLSSLTSKLYIIPKTFTLAYPSIDKPRFKAHRRYIMIIKRF